MRAALRTTYGLDLRLVIESRSLPATELAEFVMWLPAGSAFWQSFGGPLAVSHDIRELRHISYWLRVLDYRERGSKGEKPKPDPEPEWAHERKGKQDATAAKADAYRRRQDQRSEVG